MTQTTHDTDSASAEVLRENWAEDFLFEQYPDAILIIDAKGFILDANHHILKIFGYEKKELIGHRIEILMPERYRAGHVAKHKSYGEKGYRRPMKTGNKFEGQKKDGTVFPIDIMLAPAQASGERITVTVIRDISEKKALENQAHEARDALQAVFNAAPVAIFVLDKEKTVLSWSHEAEKLFGYSAEEVVGQPYKLIPTDGEGKLECTSLLDEVFSGKTVRNVQRRRIHQDGSLVDVEISAAPLRAPDGSIYAAAYTAQDISERLRAERNLNKLAYFNQFTGLPNLSCLKKDLQELLPKRRQANEKPFFIAKLKLHGIVEVNDTLGRESVERLILTVCRRLSGSIPDCGTVYQASEDEFAITMPDCGSENSAQNFINSLFKIITIPYKINGQQVLLDACLGLAVCPTHGSDADELLANANLALEVARSSKSKNIRIFERSMKTRAQTKRELDIALYHAYKNGEFELFYQPQVRISDGELVGAEALLRWRHPERGLISPDGFIDALTRHATAYDVGNWVLRRALKQTAFWRANGFPDFCIGVNLFAAQFEEDSLVRDTLAALEHAGLPPQALELEITENIAIGFDKTVIEPLRKLKQKGIGIAFDDFGTGYASLSYLVKYPLTRIKIDKSFLEHVPENEEEAAIIRATIQMAHGLGLQVIAEGIETRAHLDFLAQENCNEGQGYLFAKPLPAAEFFELAKSMNAQKTMARIA